jgi:hypothetical protein
VNYVDRVRLQAAIETGLGKVVKVISERIFQQKARSIHLDDLTKIMMDELEIFYDSRESDDQNIGNDV